MKNKGFTIIELLLCVFIISTLTFGIISAINFTLTQNSILAAKNSAYLIADNSLKNKESASEFNVKYDNVDFEIKLTETKKKPKELLDFSDDYLKMISDNVEIRVRKAEVKWNIGNRGYSIYLEKYETAEL
ncbi:MAG TPA: prepilin-type N-terminal cleavage/methylation domain-containing protein [bacterium]|nr:prepilin-type N-terminal cleavage/methylation domain-containing protein [bacterium]HPN31967.1 prepilin-type N-terminal cleavage/methylation domain-containing protein [bacterium]